VPEVCSCVDVVEGALLLAEGVVRVKVNEVDELVDAAALAGSMKSSAL
jgi:leucyl aminopeptidase